MEIDILPETHKSVRYWRCSNNTYGNARWLIYGLDFYGVWPGLEHMTKEMKSFGLKEKRNKSIWTQCVYVYEGQFPKDKIEQILNALSNL